MTSNRITASEILEERDQARRAGVIAHTPNSSGEMMARVGCACYNCRDIIDPTGEEDAAAANQRLADSLPSLRVPTNMPAQVGCPNSPHPPPPFPTYKNLCCQRSPLNLPVPAPAHRQPSTQSSGTLSPIVGVQSPDTFSFHFRINLRSPSLSRESSCVEDTCVLQERTLVKRLHRLLETYQSLQSKIDTENRGAKSHDEMAMNDAQWDEIDSKIAATEALLDLLKKE